MDYTEADTLLEYEREYPLKDQIVDVCFPHAGTVGEVGTFGSWSFVVGNVSLDRRQFL